MNEAAIERRLSSHELGFQDLDTPARLQVVSGVIFLSANVRSETIWARIRKFVEANPLFRCRIEGHRSPEWKVDSSFDLSKHCDEIAVGDVTTEHALSFVSNAASRGLSGDQPPWRIALLRLADGSGQPARCAIAILAHHSLLDGLQGMKLFTSLLDRTASPLGTKIHSAEVTSDHSRTKTPVISADCVRNVASEMLRRPSDGPFASNRMASAKRTTLAFEWSRRSFQAVRRSGGASFQEVLLAALTDALARYSRSRGLKRNLRAILPLARPENHPSSFTTNRHDVGYIDLPTASAHSHRHKTIRQNLKFLRREQEHDVFSSILAFMGRLPNVVRKAVARRFAHQADLLISLIPVGRSKDTIDGAEVTSLFAQPALPPRHSVVVGITVARHHVCVTVQVDPACINHPEELKTCFEQAYRRTVLAEAGEDGPVIRAQDRRRSVNHHHQPHTASAKSLGWLKCLASSVIHSRRTDPV